MFSFYLLRRVEEKRDAAGILAAISDSAGYAGIDGATICERVPHPKRGADGQEAA
jgi:hypothetical protein